MVLTSMIKILTKEEALEKYGEINVSFVSYSKYTFVFRRTIKDGHVIITVGGSGPDIYDLEVGGWDYPIKNYEISTLSVYSSDMKTLLEHYQAE